MPRNTANSSLATAQAPLQAAANNVIQQEAKHALRATPNHFTGRGPLSCIEPESSRRPLEPVGAPLDRQLKDLSMAELKLEPMPT